jgi:hypothetical protein
MTLRNTGIEPIRLSVALSNITLDNLLLTQTGVHYMNYGIYANAAVTNLTVKNVRVSNLQDNCYALWFAGTVTNLMIDSLSISGGSGGTARGIQFQGATNGLTIKNSLFDLDDPATINDGDYGIVFASTAINVTIDSTIFRDIEVYDIYVTGVATNFTIKNTTFDNLDGYENARFVRFVTNVNTVLIDSCNFNADKLATTNDADYGILFEGAASQNVTITNNKFADLDVEGIYMGLNGTNNHDNILIKKNTFTRIGSGATASGGIDFLARNVTGDGGAVLITMVSISLSGQAMPPPMLFPI